MIITNTNITRMCNENKYACTTVTVTHVGILLLAYLMDC